MNIIDCSWEKKNIGRSTVEITINRDDRIRNDMFDELLCSYEYVVVKVPMNMIEYNYLLSNLGFILMEVQLNVHSLLNEFKWNCFSLNLDDIKFEMVSSINDIYDITQQITNDMFSTDRVTLDKNFGAEIGRNRYVNWIKSDCISNKSQIARVIYKNHNVGFMMFKIEDRVFHLLLNGLYKKWQGLHLGILTPGTPIIYSKRNGNIDIVKTSISSNNIPVVKLYNRLGYVLDNQTYVFVKHCI